MVLLESSVNDPPMGHRLIILRFWSAETATGIRSALHDRFRLSHAAVSTLIFNPSFLGHSRCHNNLSLLITL